MRGIVWQQRIRHLDRSLGRVQARRFMAREDKERVKRRRGYPPRNVSKRALLLRLRLRLAVARGQPVQEIAALRRQLHHEAVRERMLWRKRERRRLVAARKPDRSRTGINLWRERQQWLAAANALASRVAAAPGA